MVYGFCRTRVANIHPSLNIISPQIRSSRAPRTQVQEGIPKLEISLWIPPLPLPNRVLPQAAGCSRVVAVRILLTRKQNPLSSAPLTWSRVFVAGWSILINWKLSHVVFILFLRAHSLLLCLKLKQRRVAFSSPMSWKMFSTCIK